MRHFLLAIGRDDPSTAFPDNGHLPNAMQVPLARALVAVETREVKVAFLGGLLGGGAAIDDSKSYICVDCGCCPSPSLTSCHVRGPTRSAVAHYLF